MFSIKPTTQGLIDAKKELEKSKADALDALDTWAGIDFSDVEDSSDEEVEDEDEYDSDDNVLIEPDEPIPQRVIDAMIAECKREFEANQAKAAKKAKKAEPESDSEDEDEDSEDEYESDED